MTVKVGELKITVPANGGERLYVVTDFINVKASTGPLRFKGENLDATLSQGQRVRTGQLSRLEVENETAAAITATLTYGTGDFSDNSVAGQVEVSRILLPKDAYIIPDVIVPAVTGITLRANQPNRREITVQNIIGNTAIMRVSVIHTATATRGLQIQPGQAVTLRSLGNVYVYNPAAESQAVSYLELLD